MHKVEKDILRTVPNSEQETLLQSYSHLRGVVIDDNDTKAELLFHIVLGTSDFSKIKTNMPAKIGKTGELTKFGWMIMPPGPEGHSNVYLTHSITHGYEQLYRLAVLGLVDTSDGDQNIIYTEFKEQLQWSTQGYQTGLPWKPSNPTLHNNKNGSPTRLSNLLLSQNVILHSSRSIITR